MKPQLNPAQDAAVVHGDGPLLILAGAGSGKTRVITARIVELLRRGVAAHRILAVTFTNKAAGEMRHRVSQLLDDEAAGSPASGEPSATANTARTAQPEPVARRGAGGLEPSGGSKLQWIGTFHATCARLLRIHCDAVGLKRDFTIFDDNDTRSLMVRVLKELEVADRFVTPRAMLSAIDSAKNRGIFAEDYRGDDYFTDLVARVYPVYQRRLAAANAVDFGDLLLTALRLCRHADVGPRLAQRFDHVLVDEFQDTNRVQYDLVRHLSSRTHNLCVVGDDDQSIYRWRGADLRNILDFERDHPGAAVVKLEQNYRSTQIILDAANAVIAHNLFRKEKRLFTEQSGGDPILYYTAIDERREAEFIVRAIRSLESEEGRSPDDFAVFYRTHAQSRVLEEAMRAADLPYTIVGGTRFYDRAEVKDLLSYLRALANPDDEVSLERIINRPARGIGDNTFDKVVAEARGRGVSVWIALEELALVPGAGDLGNGPRKKLLAFVELMQGLRSDAAQCALGALALPALAERVLERSGYLEKLAGERNHEAQDRIENLMELVGSMRDFAREEEARNGAPPTLTDYLERVSLVAPADTNGKGVLMMTVHASKGLEFPVVFVTGLEEGVFPSLRDGEDADALEEERRLAYVAITRARERLFFTNARARMLFGQEARPFQESRFIADVPEALVARPVGSQRARAESARDRLREHTADRLRRPRAVSDDSVPADDWSAQQRRKHQVARVERDDGTAVEYDEPPPPDDAAVEHPFHVGQRVRHQMFGEGEVRGFTGLGRDLRLTVYFPNVGPKTVVARYVEVV